MSNPQISFRISPYQLARGLKIIRAIEPTYHPSSASQLVKAIYIDYLAKMSLNKSDDITAADLDEAAKLSARKQSPMSLEAFQQACTGITNAASEPTTEPTTESTTESKITSATDFSPPSDWKK